MRRIRDAAVAAVGVIAVSVAVACGGDGGGSSGEFALEEAETSMLVFESCVDLGPGPIPDSGGGECPSYVENTYDLIDSLDDLGLADDDRDQFLTRAASYVADACSECVSILDGERS